MMGFRIKVDLSYFYSDYKQFVYVLLNSELRTVESLQKRVRTLFNLPKVVLLAQGCYLSPFESIEVIQEGDVLKALPKKNHDKGNIAVNDLKADPKFQQEQKECDITPLLKKRKRDENDNKSDSLSSSTPKIKKLSDSDLFKNANLSLDVPIRNNIESEIESESLHKQNASDLTGLCENEIEIGFDKAQNIRSPKKKRPRKRKKKINTLSNQDIIQNKPSETNVASSENAVKHNHVHFDDSGKPIANGQEETQKIIFVNFLDTQDKLKPRVIKAINNISQTQNNQTIRPENSNSIQNKNIIISNRANSPKESQFNGVESNSKDGATDSLNEDFSADKESTTAAQPLQSINGTLDSEKKDENLNAPLQDVNSFKISEVLPFSKPLQGPLANDDVILFKIYRLNEKYEPSISEYICGKFEGYVQETNLLKIFIIDGQDQINGSGKFSMNLDAEQPNHIFLEMEDLIDKRIFVL